MIIYFILSPWNIQLMKKLQPKDLTAIPKMKQRFETFVDKFFYFQKNLRFPIFSVACALLVWLWCELALKIFIPLGNIGLENGEEFWHYIFFINFVHDCSTWCELGWSDHSENISYWQWEWVILHVWYFYCKLCSVYETFSYPNVKVFWNNGTEINSLVSG